MKEDKKKKIFAAARKVFGQYGFKRTRMEDIADELGITKGNLYLYARDKRDLYESAVAEALLEWQASAIAEMKKCDTAEEQFVVYAVKGYEHIAQNDDLRKIIMLDPGIFPPYPTEDPFYEINRASMQILKDILKHGVDCGEFRTVDIEPAGEMLYSIYMMFINKAFVKSEEHSTLEMYQEGIFMIMNGLKQPNAQ